MKDYDFDNLAEGFPLKSAKNLFLWFFSDKHFSHECSFRDLASSFDIPVIKGSMAVQNNFTQIPYIL